MTNRVTINVITSECDEWFDSEYEADRYIENMEDGEYLQAYHYYVNGVQDFEKSFFDELP